MSAGSGDNNGDRRMTGSLREALAAAARSGPAPVLIAAAGDNAPKTPPPLAPPASAPENQSAPSQSLPSAAQAAQEARGAAASQSDEAPQTRVVRPPAMPRTPQAGGAARTQLVRGKGPTKRADFHQDPVVGWLVVVGGAGLGAFRPIFEGNNTVGRGPSQRIAIDFGDETISSEEQAYIRYDSVDRRFLLVPNLAKTNIVAVNNHKPTSAVELAAMDVITMGRTQLVFVPFCGSEFDWAELTEMQA